MISGDAVYAGMISELLAGMCGQIKIYKNGADDLGESDFAVWDCFTVPVNFENPVIKKIPAVYTGFEEHPERNDYIKRPFDFDEFLDFVSLTAGIDMGFEKMSGHIQPEADSFRIDDDKKTVSFNGIIIELTEKEYALFRILYENAPEPVSRKEISGRIWNEKDTNISDVYIHYLRNKLEKCLGFSIIKTVRNIGYALIIKK